MPCPDDSYMGSKMTFDLNHLIIIITLFTLRYSKVETGRVNLLRPQ